MGEQREIHAISQPHLPPPRPLSAPPRPLSAPPSSPSLLPPRLPSLSSPQSPFPSPLSIAAALWLIVRLQRRRVAADTMVKSVREREVYFS
jgi:hypothetical protein